MIEIKPHFIKLEETRLTYSIPFSNLDNHIVYGKLKDVEGDYIVNQPYTEVIPKSDYSYSDGKIIFSNKPCTLYPYDSIKIVELQDYNNREVEFTGNGSITSTNLNTEFNEHSSHIQLIEKLLKSRVFIDSENTSNQTNLPKLLNDTFWVFKDKAIVAYKLQYLKDEYQKNTSKLLKDAFKYLKEILLPSMREEIALEQDKIISAAGGAYLPKVNTIYDLKQSKRFKVGDVIKVLGYHSSDDGGEHIRKKMPSDYRGEDIVVGIDGSIWGIVHDGTVNVSWFGAKGDGINDDTAAIQKAVNLAKVIRIPKGVFYLSSPIRTKNGTTWNETTSQGVHIIGDVTGTTLTRKKPIQQGELEIEYSNQACINIHCSYNIIENLNIEDSPIGIFMGQNVNFEQDNYCSFNKIDKINVKNCGTGFFASNDGGNTYNRFSNLHFISCQISFRTKAGRYANTPYFNRNYLDNIRATRTYIGLFLQDADTNTIQSFHCENIGAEIGGLKFPVPNIYPDICNEKKYIGHLIDRSNKNIITNSTMEKVDTTLINNGTEAVFLNNLYRENFPASRNPVIFVTKPHTFISGDTILLNKSTIGIVTNNKTELPEIMEGYFNTPKLNVNELNTSFNAARKIETKNEHLNIGIGECIVLTPRVITKNNLSILEYEIIFANEAQLYGGLCEGKAILQSSKNANTTARIKNLEHKVSGYSIGGGVISNEALVCTTKIIDGKGVVEIVNNSGYPINAITTITETICKGCDVDVFSIMKEKYTNEMIKEGVYEDFLSYTNLKENYDNTDFLSKRNRMILPEPIPSEKLISFKEKYFG